MRRARDMEEWRYGNFAFCMGTLAGLAVAVFAVLMARVFT